MASSDDDYMDDDYDASQKAAKNALMEPQTYKIHYKDINEYIKSGVVNLNAPYQRDVVWNDTKQSHLIDSFVKNYYVPPVIFSIREDRRVGYENTEIRVAIDGKQRLTSIHRFMEGEIPQIDSTTNERIWYKKPRHRKTAKRILSEGERQAFSMKLLMCVEYRDLTDEQEQEIFRRVQLGVALTTAEKMFARPGPTADFVRKLMEVIIVADIIRKSNINNKIIPKEFKDLCGMVEAKRKLTFQILLQIIVIVWDKPEKVPSAQYLDKVLKGKEPVETKKRALIESVLQVFGTLMEEAPEIFKSPARMAPIEFAMSAYLIATKEDHMVRELRDDIAVMRETTRKQFLDIRFNQRTYQYMKKLIDKM